MKWRVIPLEEHDAAMNMAIDHAIRDAVLSGESPPTIRFYTWRGGGVSFGFDKFESLINKEACAEDGVSVVRRPSGGNAVYHAPEDLTYAVICPQELLGIGRRDDINETAYKTICSWIICALDSLGVESKFYEENDIVEPHTLKKLVGNAQRKRSGSVLLQHGAIFVNAQPEKWARYINVPARQLEGITSLHARGVKDAFVVYEALLDAFMHNEQVRTAYIGELTAQEQEQARKLAQEIYSTSKDPAEYHLRKGTACVVDHFKQ